MSAENVIKPVLMKKQAKKTNVAESDKASSKGFSSKRESVGVREVEIAVEEIPST